MLLRSVYSLFLVGVLCGPLQAQQATPVSSGSTYKILGLTVEGATSEGTRNIVIQASGLRTGQEVTLPLDAAFSDALRDVYKLDLFTDVKLVEERRVGDGVFLRFDVEEAPRLRDYRFEGVKKGWRDDLRKELPFIKGARVSETDLRRAEMAAEQFHAQKGFPLAQAQATTTTNEDGSMDVVVAVNRGARVQIGDIEVVGNEEVSDRRLRKTLKNTKPKAWWKFWGRSTFKEDKLDEDLESLVAYYHKRGYYDAHIVRDTHYVRVEDGKPEVVLEIGVHEGPQYHIRDIEWEGNTLYTDETLSNTLALREGDVFNRERYEANLHGNRAQNDVSSLYQNQGYLRFGVQPTIRVAPGDSLDLLFDVFEGDVYDFGAIRIAGNDKTKEHVIRRELYTIPGQPYSRESIIESIRRLSQLNYFNAETLQQGPGMDVDDESKTVDLSYNVEEVGGDQLELSGTWGRIGLILQLRLTFNNFSAQNLFNGGAWDPLPMGDGQQLSLAVQTSGLAYQNYSISFTEPWFRGRPTPIGFSLGFNKIDYSKYRSLYSTAADRSNAFRFLNFSARGFYSQRLKWPDDKFSHQTGLGYRFYDLSQNYGDLPKGISHELTFEQRLTRNSQDHPIFPRRGSNFEASLEIAPPVPGFIQYHKWGLKNAFNAPFTNRLTLGISTQFGYVGSFKKEGVQFQRFLLGGSPFESQGLNSTTFGKDIVYLRSYPLAALGPQQNGEAVGGRILNKYTAEVRWLAVQSPQLQAAPYLFMDAANTWDSFNSYNPSQLYRSAGVGVRLFLPILGMLEFAYGYRFDQYTPISADENGERGWKLQFTIGQGFNQ